MENFALMQEKSQYLYFFCLEDGQSPTYGLWGMGYGLWEVPAIVIFRKIQEKRENIW
jgi:hypothetical protein